MFEASEEYLVCFASTTPWLYKAFHLLLVISGFQDHVLLLSVYRGLLMGMTVVTFLLLFPSAIHSVRNRVLTTSLIVQSFFMLSLMMNGLVYLAHLGYASLVPVCVQILSGHFFFSLASASVKNKGLLVYGPIVCICFGLCSIVVPVLASIAGPRAESVQGIRLVIFLGLGEAMGILVFVLAQLCAMGGKLYESVVRYLVE